MKRAIIYVRGKDREKQENICKEYAEKNGFEVVEIVLDLKEVLTKDFDALLVSQLKVITRDVYDKVIYTRKLKDRNIDLILTKAGVKYEDVSELVFDYMELTLDSAKVKKQNG